MKRRRHKKSGKEDVGSDWAKARLAQAKQFKEQLRRGKNPDEEHPDDGLFPIHLDGIAFWDEFHMKVRLGHASKWEVLMCRHPDTEDICLESEGGEWDEEKPNTSMKYPGEARVWAGACMITNEDGEREGVGMELFDYTGKTVVGLKAWEKAKLAELARVKTLAGCWGAEGHGYEERYGGNWEEEVEKKLRGSKLGKGIVPITDVSPTKTKFYLKEKNADKKNPA